MRTKNFYDIFSKIFCCTWACGCQRFVQYIHMLCPGRTVYFGWICTSVLWSTFDSCYWSDRLDNLKKWWTLKWNIWQTGILNGSARGKSLKKDFEWSTFPQIVLQGHIFLLLGDLFTIQKMHHFYSRKRQNCSDLRQQNCWVCCIFFSTNCRNKILLFTLLLQ